MIRLAVAAFAVTAALALVPAARCTAGPACLAAAAPTDTPVVRAPHEIRVVLGSAADGVTLDASTDPWELRDAWGRPLARATDGQRWRVERDSARIRAVSLDGRRPTAWSDEPFMLVPSAGGFVGWNGRRYRGELHFLASDTALLVANVLPVEEYLRGVVPLEIGARPASERAAVEAQAIAARSYTVVRALEAVGRRWDLTARTVDQVYGGVDAETAAADAAVRATAGVVLTFGGQVVRAPYSAACGGATATPREVFRGNGESWLRSVSDRIPGTDRHWCDIAPRFHWERRFGAQELAQRLARQPVGRGVRSVRSARVSAVTPSGRAQGLVFSTDRGEVTVNGNDLRFALTGTAGDILPSTSFEAQWLPEGQALLLRGRGNGHGVGLCQWGAIGRARAGMDAPAILTAYFPGTRLAVVRRVDPVSRPLPMS